MKYCHLSHEQYTIAAIEDIIARGQGAGLIPLIIPFRAAPYGDIVEKPAYCVSAPCSAALYFAGYLTPRYSKNLRG
ncbi:MAG: hypothetical protein HQK97_06225 [Nitrospirae bacterium]|nr:hypothetical protein [Nitrospirota bacterium]